MNASKQGDKHQSREVRYKKLKYMYVF